jgi:hypothetical protein
MKLSKKQRFFESLYYNAKRGKVAMPSMGSEKIQTQSISLDNIGARQYRFLMS